MPFQKNLHRLQNRLTCTIYNFIIFSYQIWYLNVFKSNYKIVVIWIENYRPEEGLEEEVIFEENGDEEKEESETEETTTDQLPAESTAKIPEVEPDLIPQDKAEPTIPGWMQTKKLHFQNELQSLFVHSNSFFFDVCWSCFPDICIQRVQIK